MSLTNIEKNITLDVYDHDTTPSVIKAIQMDKGTRTVYAGIQNSRQDYDIGQNASVSLTVLRPDKTRVQIVGETFISHTGTDGTMYGAKAYLSDVALAVKGNLKAQFKITSGEQELRTEIFTISNGEALDADDGDWAGDLDGHNLDEMAESIETLQTDMAAVNEDVSDLKEEFNDLYNTAYVTDSASGSVAHFVDGADDVPLKSIKVNIAPVQSGSGDPSPSNVRPISGWDAVKVTRSGKNVLKPPTISTTTHNGITFTYMPDGGIKCNGTSTGAAYSSKQNDFRLQVGQYTKNPQDTNGVGVIVQTMTTPDWTSVQGGGVADRTVVIKEEDTKYTLAVRIRVPSGITLTDYVIYPMLRLVSDTDDTYEPYNGNTYDISLASAGTVYGGTLDVVSGELTVTTELYSVTSVSGTATSGNVRRFFTTKDKPSATAVVCNSLKLGGQSDLNDVFVNDEGRIVMTPDWAQSMTTAEEFNSELASHPINLVITLATPLTYQLSATEIKSLLGINNVWSDAGDVEVEYRADTKLYIKRLTDSDTDMIADSNIVSGQYFMVGNDLYKATVNIASGAQIVVGTNAAKVSLSEALNEINA